MSDTKLKIQDDLKTAMKAREQHKVTTLRGIMAAIKQFEVDQRAEQSEEQVVNILQQEIRKRRDALKYAEQQNREDLINQNTAEIAILQEYLGKPLSDEELKRIILAKVEAGATTVGQIMKELTAEYKGLYDGKKASTLAAESLKK